MSISQHQDAARELTIFTVTGELTFAAQMEALRRFYGEAPTANMLWDFRRLEGSRISSEELRRIIAFIRGQKDKRPYGKTALVSTSDLDFGLSRMSEAYAQSEGLPWDIQAFRSMAEALRWLETDAEPG